MKMITLLSSAHNYERDAPNMSRVISLKCGGKVVKRFIFADPVHFISGVRK